MREGLDFIGWQGCQPSVKNAKLHKKSKLIYTFVLMVTIDYKDVLTISAISAKPTSLSSIIAYWDCFNRGYPKYSDFINSIKKLETLGIIEIHDRSRYGKISSTLQEYMSLAEKVRCRFLSASKYHELVRTVLNRLEAKRDAIGLMINEEEYNDIIREYYPAAFK